MKLQVWRPEHGETIEDAVEMDEWDAETAVEKLMDNHHSDWDYPEEVAFMVKNEEGKIEKYSCTAEPTVHFHAYLIKDKS